MIKSGVVDLSAVGQEIFGSGGMLAISSSTVQWTWADFDARWKDWLYEQQHWPQAVVSHMKFDAQNRVVQMISMRGCMPAAMMVVGVVQVADRGW